jgi:hypothetical protein
MAPSGMCSDGTTTDAQKLANLETLLRACFGTKLIGLWIGDDIVVDGSNNVTSWPHRVGAAFANGNASRATVGALNGRRVLVGVGNTAYLTTTLAASISTIMLVVVPSPRLLSFAVYADSPANDGSIQENTNAAFPSPLYVAGGWAHTVDLVATENLAATSRVIWGNTVMSPSAQLNIGTAAGPFMNQGKTALIIALSSAASAGEVANSDAIVRTYYSL